MKPSFAPLTALAVAVLFAAPALAQRAPTGKTTTTPTRATAPSRSAPITATKAIPADDAAAALKAGQPAGTVARSLVDTHRLESADVARTLIHAGYDPGSVGLALSVEMRVPPERAWADLAAAGVAEELIFGTMMEMVRERHEALEILREQIGSRQAIAIIQKSDALEASKEEIAADMAATGYSLEEIIEVLTGDPHSMSADEILALFLELNLASADDAEMYGWLREKGLTARDAVAAMAEDVAAGSRAEVLRASGYTWDAIVDALKWTGESAMEAAKAAYEAGAPLADMVEWLVDTGGEGAGEILEGFEDTQADVLTVAEALLDANVSATQVAVGLSDAGVSLEDIVELLMDQGLSAEEIVAILEELQASVATIIHLLVTTMQMSHENAMAVIAAGS